MRKTLFAAAFIAVAIVVGCGTSSLTTVSTDVCASGKRWEGGDDGEPIMHPGQDCIACHMKESDAPKFQVAGTVFPDAHGADDCGGSSGATVEITDATGKVFTMTTNEAGNFYLESKDGAITFPYKAKVKANGKEVAMVEAQSVGACNSCHTMQGASAAPGRIQLPQ